MNNELTQDRLKHLLDYDAVTGAFAWRNPRSNNCREGSVAGNVEKQGYRVIMVDGQLYKAHRLAWLYVYGLFPEKHIDHKNHLRDDNRIDNLREVNNQGNCQNRGLPSNNTSGVVGVRLVESIGKWRAEIGKDGKRFNLGYFSDKVDAVAARKAAEVELGFHENHGAVVASKFGDFIEDEKLTSEGCSEVEVGDEPRD